MIQKRAKAIGSARVDEVVPGAGDSVRVRVEMRCQKKEQEIEAELVERVAMKERKKKRVKRKEMRRMSKYSPSSWQRSMLRLSGIGVHGRRRQDGIGVPECCREAVARWDGSLSTSSKQSSEMEEEEDDEVLAPPSLASDLTSTIASRVRGPSAAPPPRSAAARSMRCHASQLASKGEQSLLLETHERKQSSSR